MQYLTIDKVNEINIELSKYHSIDVICLNETWVNANFLNQMVFHGFSLASYFCRRNYNGGGCAIWMKNNVKFKKVCLDCFSTDKDLEICGISYRADRKREIFIILVYRSPNGNDCNFFDNLYKVLNFVYRPSRDIIMCGDFNIDPIRDNTKYVKMCNIALNFNLISQVKWPTRLTINTESTIDNIFTNFENGITNVVLDNNISDHRSLYIEFTETSTLHKTEAHAYTYKRCYSQNAILRFESFLITENWTLLYNFQDIDKAFEYFHRIFCHHFNVSFPIRKCVVYNQNRWINSNVIRSSENLKTLYGFKVSNPCFTNKYNEEKRKHRKLIENTKKEYYRNKIFKSDNLSKAVWGVVNDLTNRKKTMSNIEIKFNDDVISDPDSVSNSFNTFFKNAPYETVKKILPNGTQTISSETTKNKLTNCSNFLFPYLENELYSLLYANMKNKCSSGIDGIPTFLLKKVLINIIKPMTHLVNLSFCIGQFPSDLKTGKVVPIYKKNDRTNMNNYRPITVSMSFSKIFEYAFLHRLTAFLEKNKIITPNQYGFRSGRSTTMAVTCFYESIINSLELGECPVGIFCDLSRAFDCINHQTLMRKLSVCGISGSAYRWISSFVMNRKQYVSLLHVQNNVASFVNSGVTEIDIGVPQGSVLGPVLFILYINDIEDVTSDAEFTLYADDTSIKISNKSSIILENKCNIVLNEVNHWLNNNQLFLNLEKTTFLRFHHRQKTCPDLNVHVGSDHIYQSRNIKFLGIFVDENMNLKRHCEHVISKLCSYSYMLRNLRSVLLEKELVSIYYAHIETHLRYGVILWGWSTESSEVFIAQKRAVRAIAGISQRVSCKSLFQRYNILTLPSLFIYEMSVYVFQNQGKFQLNRDNCAVNTRNKNELHIPFVKYTTSSKSPNILGPRIFNLIPNNIKQCKSLNIFKKQLRNFLVDKCFYSLSDFVHTY